MLEEQRMRVPNFCLKEFLTRQVISAYDVMMLILFRLWNRSMTLLQQINQANQGSLCLSVRLNTLRGENIAGTC